MNLLVTGGAGFIGSNFIKYMLERYSDIHFVNLDKLTYAGNLCNLGEVERNKNYTFIQGDICNKKLVASIFAEYEIDGVIHFAAESHVDNSINNPLAFVETNILGTSVLLETARKYWMEGPNLYKENFQKARFHHISTDEVYGTLKENGFFTEKTPYAPNSPYSASKASSDLLVRSYFHTYGMNVVTTNCSNNFGPHQHDEKLIPTIIRKALSVKEIPIYGNGKNVRDWLFVEDHCKAIEQVFFYGKQGETYLIGGHNEKSNIEIANEICKILNRILPIKNEAIGIRNYEELITFVPDRPGHDFRYAIDDSKFRSEFNGFLQAEFGESLNKTVKYYINKYS